MGEREGGRVGGREGGRERYIYMEGGRGTGGREEGGREEKVRERDGGPMEYKGESKDEEEECVPYRCLKRLN